LELYITPVQIEMNITNLDAATNTITNICI
jgi:hypothetical protein